MTRVKTFDNTGIATAGRLYAGDLNLIQDQYADLTNLGQTHAVGNLQVGESGLQLLRYGPGEARISGMLRTDGILRALGGLYAGAFTTAQRDAIASGSRPYGLVILNTTNNRLEWNAGTDAAPNWQPISDTAGVVPIGTTIEWPWTHTSLPANYLLPYGQAISRTTYPVLAALAAASAYPHGNGDGSTTFNLPDYRGRVGVGRDDMGGTAASRITSGGSGIPGATLGAAGGVQNVALATGELPVHNHGSTALTVTGTPSLSGAVSNNTLAVAIGSLAATIGTLSATVGTLSVGVGSLGLPNHGHSHNLSLPHHIHILEQVPGAIQSGHGVQLSGGWEEDDVEGYLYTAGPTTLPAIDGSVNNPSSLPGISGVPSFSGAPALSGVPSLSGVPTLTGGISNGTLAATLGTLDVGGTTDNAGSGTAHQNMQPSIVVNRAIRVS